MAGIFPDSKTFVDCIPKFPLPEIFGKYMVLEDPVDLMQFVLDNFTMPEEYASDFKSDSKLSMKEHIGALWPVLTRKGSEDFGTLIQMTNDYIVPGGRFRESYYWDTYFAMLGLTSSDKFEKIEGMLDNFNQLLNQFGHIPNGNRSYYLSRSQPPFFSLMVELLVNEKGNQVLEKYLPALQKEYNFWMDGSEKINSENPAFRRVVRMPNDSILNRYYDDSNTPRPESYEEDILLAKESGRLVEEVYRELKAAAESGWDFSSRWLGEDNKLTSIETSKIIPIDLNSLLFKLEMLLATAYLRTNDMERVSRLTQSAIARQEAIDRYCWDEQQGFYFDYHWENGKHTNKVTLAGMFPFFVQLAPSEKMKPVVEVLQNKLLKPGGLVTTTVKSGEQWDSPNGWAPLQWIAIKGLKNYNQQELADEISKRWLNLNEAVYKRTGKMVEKYDVEDLTHEAGGGEYPLQDGFAWTNGVAIALLNGK